MVQKKPKSLRILKSNKNASTSPIVYFIGGLLIGVVCSTLFYVYLLPLINTQEVTCTQAVTESVPVTHDTKQNTTTENSAEAEVITQQPKEAELSKIFTHAPPAKVPQPTKTSASTVKGNVEPKTEASPFFDQMFKGSSADKPNEKERKPNKTASEVKTTPTVQKPVPQKAPFEGLK